MSMETLQQILYTKVRLNQIAAYRNAAIWLVLSIVYEFSIHIHIDNSGLFLNQITIISKYFNLAFRFRVDSL